MKIAALVVASLSLFVAISSGAGTETSRKQTELVKLLHYTKEMAEFRDRIKVGTDELKKANPETRTKVWDDMAREVRADEYTQWVLGLMDRMLTEQDVKTLNAIMSDLKKNGALSDLLGQVAGKRGKDYTAAIDKFKRLYDYRLADELVSFLQSEAGGRYVAFREVKAADQGPMTTKLLREAHQRALARNK